MEKSNHLAKLANRLIEQNKTTSHSSRQCTICGRDIPAIEVELLGQMRWVQPSCACEKKAKLEEIDQLVKAKEQYETRQLFSISNIGKKYLEATFENFQLRTGSENAFKIAKHYAENFDEYKNEAILLWGDVGNGKTHLAAAIHNYLTAQGKTVVFISMPELLSKIKATFNQANKETEQQILKALAVCDLLIIDDLGAEKTTDWVQEKFFEILDSRNRHEKPVLATSNVSPNDYQDVQGNLRNDLAEKIGKRSFDRILEMSQPIENKASSYRRENAINRISKFNKILGGE